MVTAQSHAPRPAAPAPAQTRFVPGQQQARAKSKSGGSSEKIKKFAVPAAIVVILALGAYFGWPYVSKWQDQMNEKRRAAEKNSGFDGGEVGHIAELNSVLDATDPAKRGSTREITDRVPKSRRAAAAAAIPVAGDAPAADPQAADKTLPVVPPIWTLDVAKAKIPEGRVNGSISGTNFVAESTRINKVGTADVLSLRQGSAVSPDREILVYLHVKPGETVAGHTWTISEDMKGSEVPQVAKRWKTNPKYAPQNRPFTTGYAMKLELGQLTNGAIPGKVFIALPDTEQTVVAGIFNALTNAPELAPALAVPTAPQPRPMAPAANPAADAAFKSRYGVKR
jgi:hypothetical protein